MDSYRIDVISLFPGAFDSLNKLGVIGRAFSSDLAKLYVHNPRDFALDRYRKVDDEPYGGGPGMVIKPEPVFAAFDSIPATFTRRVVLLTPQGRPLQQCDLQRLALSHDHLVLICGQYEGFDERIRTLADEEICVGDFVVTGGELPAMTLINGVVRLLPGTVGSSDSLVDESHSSNLLEHPHYTRPARFRDMVVPKVLLSGDHKAINLWRQNQRELRTKNRRPDLFSRWVANQDPRALRMDSIDSNAMNLRIGNGYDIHRLVKGRPLIIGGVELKHPDGLGLDGHSDADVLVHAVMDALLGALALGDIGKYFPPEDPKWLGADSMELLEKVVELVGQNGWRIINSDAVLVAERPKIKPHINTMRSNLAKRMNVEVDAVGVKATTNECLGAEGREEGISCQAVVLLQNS